MFAKRGGFGLLEAVIASGILVILASVSVGLSTVIIKGSSSYDPKIVANNLAQTGIEAAYAARQQSLNDNNSITAWSNGFINGKNSGGVNISLTCNDINNISSGGCGIYQSEKSIINSINGTGGDVSQIYFTNQPDSITYNDTAFTRKIFFQKVDDNKFNVRSVVFEADNTSLPLADISVQLTNWKETTQ
jgi:hypothetical protein